MTKITDELCECPMCESLSIYGDERDFGYGYASQKIICEDCNFEWEEVYSITSIYIFEAEENYSDSDELEKCIKELKEEKKK